MTNYTERKQAITQASAEVDVDAALQELAAHYSNPGKVHIRPGVISDAAFVALVGAGKMIIAEAQGRGSEFDRTSVELAAHLLAGGYYVKFCFPPEAK